MKVFFVEDENIIQTFFMGRTDPTFCECVCLGCLKRGGNDFNAFGFKYSIE